MALKQLLNTDSMRGFGPSSRAMVERVRLAERWLAWIRLFVALSGGALYPSIAKSLANVVLGQVVLVASLVYSVVIIVVTRRRDYRVVPWSFATVVMDVLLALSAIALTGGPQSPVLPAIFLLAFSFAYRYPPAPTFVGGVLATVGYVATIRWVYGPSIHVASHGSYLLVTTVLASFMSRDAFGQRLRRHEAEELAKANELAAKARLELTQESAARAAAEAAVQAREEFLSIASHELKTPLTAMMLELDLLNYAADRKSSVPSTHVHRVKKSVKRLANLVETLLDVSRMFGGRVELTSEPIELGPMVRQTCAKLGEVLNRAGCHLRVNIEEDLWARIDRMRFEQIVENLLSNASKYAQGKPVEVSLKRSRDGALLQVVDHGIGIAPEDQERIFERFQRAVPSRKYGGLGLGLWIVRQFAEHMGGSVSVRSQLGEGATFELRIPLSESQTQDDHPRYSTS